MDNTSNMVGRTSEALATFAFLSDGIDVATPLSHSEPYDLLVLQEGSWLKVQVKTAKQGTHGFTADLRHSRDGKPHQMYSPGDFDLLVVAYPPLWSLWKIPAADAITKRTLSLSSNRFAWKNCPPLEPIQRQPPKPRPWASFRDNPAWFDDPSNCTRFSSRTAPLRIAALNVLPTAMPDSFSPAQWAAITLFAQGFGYRSIAHKLGVTQGAIQERVKRAVFNLSKLPPSPAA
jgi:hypothetical protein